MSKNDGYGDSSAADTKRYGFREVWRQKKDWFLGGMILTFGGILLGTMFLIWLTPKHYEGRVRLEIKRVTTDYEVFPGNTSKERREFEDHDMFVQTEVEKLRSRETLYQVIEGLAVGGQVGRCKHEG